MSDSAPRPPRAHDHLGGSFTALRWNHRQPAFADRPMRAELHRVLNLAAETPVFDVVSTRRQLDGDPAVRRALTLAIDRRELHGVLELPDGTPVLDGMFTLRQLLRGEIRDTLPYDPLAAGWRDADGDGVRERGGQAFRFVALAPPAGSPMLEQRAAVYVQAQLRRIGIRMDVQTLDISLLSRRLRAGEFEAAFFAFFNQLRGHVEWFGEGSPIGYRNPRVIDRLRAVQATADPDVIDQIYRSLIPVFRADVPLTFLFPEVHTFVAHRRIQGLRSPFQADPVMRMEHLWLEDGR